jgi:hypothetical protein
MKKILLLSAILFASTGGLFCGPELESQSYEQATTKILEIKHGGIIFFVDLQKLPISFEPNEIIIQIKSAIYKIATSLPNGNYEVLTKITRALHRTSEASTNNEDIDHNYPTFTFIQTQSHT